MALRLVYLAASRLFELLRVAVQDAVVKDVEILMLRHQLAVAQRRDPDLARKLTWAGRAWVSLLAGLLPKTHLSRIRLLVTPGTVIGWHRDLLRRVGVAFPTIGAPGHTPQHQDPHAKAGQAEPGLGT